MGLGSDAVDDVTHGSRDEAMPYGVDTIRLRISFPAAPVSQGYNGRAWKMRPLRGWTGGARWDEEAAARAGQGGGYADEGVAIPIASAAQQASAGSSLRATLDRVIAAMSTEPPAVEAQGGEGGLTAQRSGDAPPAVAQAGTPPQPSPGVEEHNRFWWWLHDHGLAQTKREKADLLRKAMGPGSGTLVVDGDGVPVNVEQLSDDEVIELDKKLRAPPYGLPIIGPAASVMTPWGWSGSKPYNAARDQLKLPGTHNTLNGKVPTREEATRMIEEAGGKNLRQDKGHHPEGVSKHHEPHINYETQGGQKATVIVREDE